MALSSLLSLFSSDLAVDLDKQEAMLYVLQQQERARDKDRIAEERKQLYAQYMAQSWADFSPRPDLCQAVRLKTFA